MSITFFIEWLKNAKEVSSIFPSTRFLWNMMIKDEDIKNSNVIAEFWAWIWPFTKIIFEKTKNTNKKIFIIEKQENLYNKLIKKFPTDKNNIYNNDILNFWEILNNNNLSNIDLIISWVPLTMLPEEFYNWMVEKILNKYFNEKSKYIHFSYVKNPEKLFKRNFKNVITKKCYLNFPFAYVFICDWFIKK